MTLPRRSDLFYSDIPKAFKTTLAQIDWTAGVIRKLIAAGFTIDTPINAHAVAADVEFAVSSWMEEFPVFSDGLLEELSRVRQIKDALDRRFGRKFPDPEGVRFLMTFVVSAIQKHRGRPVSYQEAVTWREELEKLFTEAGARLKSSIVTQYALMGVGTLLLGGVLVYILSE